MDELPQQAMPLYGKDGELIGHYWLDALVTVRHLDGRRKTTQMGSSPPEVTAKVLLGGTGEGAFVTDCEIERLTDALKTCRELREYDRTEIERLQAVVEVARHWRRAFHHGTGEEIDLQEQCLLDALDGVDEQ